MVYQGNINMEFQSYFENYSNNIDEGLAILKDIQWYATNHIQNVIIEIESMIVFDMIKSKNTMIWKMQDIVKQIKKILKMETSRLITALQIKENIISDALANNGVTKKHEAFFTEALPLPQHVRAALKNDQDDLPNIKISVRK